VANQRSVQIQKILQNRAQIYDFFSKFPNKKWRVLFLALALGVLQHFLRHGESLLKSAQKLPKLRASAFIQKLYKATKP